MGQEEEDQSRDGWIVSARRSYEKYSIVINFE